MWKCRSLQSISDKQTSENLIMIQIITMYIDPNIVALMAQILLMVGYSLSVLAYFLGVSAH